MQHEEFEDDKELHFITVKRRRDIFSVINDYVEVICELKGKKKEVFKDQLEEYLTLLAEEIHEIATDDLIFQQLQRCGEMLNKKEYYD